MRAPGRHGPPSRPTMAAAACPAAPSCRGGTCEEGSCRAGLCARAGAGKREWAGGVGEAASNERSSCATQTSCALLYITLLLGRKRSCCHPRACIHAVLSGGLTHLCYFLACSKQEALKLSKAVFHSLGDQVLPAWACFSGLTCCCILRSC